MDVDAEAFLTAAAAVGDPTRFRMLVRLGGGPLSVGQLGAKVNVTQPAASYHVRRMRAAGLVVTIRQGPRTVVRRVEWRWTTILAALATAE